MSLPRILAIRETLSAVRTCHNFLIVTIFMIVTIALVVIYFTAALTASKSGHSLTSHDVGFEEQG